MSARDARYKLQEFWSRSVEAPSEAGRVAFGCAGAFRIGTCGMYRPSIGPVSVIERAIVCMCAGMRETGFSGFASVDFEGVCTQLQGGDAPAFFNSRDGRAPPQMHAALAGKTLQELGYKSVYNAGAFKDLAEAGLETEPA